MKKGKSFFTNGQKPKVGKSGVYGWRFIENTAKVEALLLSTFLKRQDFKI